jgi:hypothetical protein
MKTPHILPDPKDRKLVESSRTTWSLLDKLGTLPQKTVIRWRNYRSHTELIGALEWLGEDDHA